MFGKLMLILILDLILIFNLEIIRIKSKIRVNLNISKRDEVNLIIVKASFNIHNFWSSNGIFKFDPEPDPHFRLLCEHGAS